MQLRHVKMFVTFYQKKFSNIDQKKHIIMEKKVPSPQVFLLLLILSILRKTFFSKKKKAKKKLILVPRKMGILALNLFLPAPQSRLFLI